eukprot:Skav222676  [mRNA]  locus=scaffold997:714266:719747:- [translate_table: standard]
MSCHSPRRETVLRDLGPMPKEGEHFLRQGLRGLLQSQELCDVALVSSGGAAFPAHRAVLAASSPQLRARVAHVKIQADGLPAIQLDVQHSEAVKALIDCVYGTEGENCDGCYNPSSEEANRDVLALARLFELPALEDRVISTCIALVGAELDDGKSVGSVEHV